MREQLTVSVNRAGRRRARVKRLRDVEQPERGVDGESDHWHKVLVREGGVDRPVERGVVCRVVLHGLLCEPGKELRVVHIPDAMDAAEWIAVPGLA